MEKKKGNGKESKGDLDLREEAMVAARTEEDVDGVVGSIVAVAVAEANISRSATDGRPAASVVRAAIPHSLPFAVQEKRRGVSNGDLFTSKEKRHQQNPPSRERERRESIKPAGAEAGRRGIDRKFFPFSESS